MGEPKRLRVVLADDHPAVAMQLRAILEPEFEVVAVVGDGDTLVTAAATYRPDLIVTDVAMPGLDGIAAARLIRERDPGARIVLVTIHHDAGLVARGFSAGVLGYVSKVVAGEELVTAVHAVLQGERYVSPCIAAPPV